MKSLEELKVIRDRMQSQIGPRCGAGEAAPEHAEGDGPEKFIMAVPDVIPATARKLWIVLRN